MRSRGAEEPARTFAGEVVSRGGAHPGRRGERSWTGPAASRLASVADYAGTPSPVTAGNPGQSKAHNTAIGAFCHIPRQGTAKYFDSTPHKECVC